MAPVKNKIVKKQKKSSAKTQSNHPVKKSVHQSGDEEGVVTPTVAISKQPFIIDEPEVLIGVEEKVEDDGLPVAEDAEEEGEEATLDAEEINPFGDKWEE
jgi:hypothetical protein